MKRRFFFFLTVAVLMVLNRQAFAELKKSELRGRIVFERKAAGDIDVCIINADGTGLVNITNEPNLHDHFPRWSPDGTNIMYHSMKEEPSIHWPWRFPKIGQINIINPDGTGKKTIAEGGLSTWGPNSETIFYYKGSKECRVLNLKTGVELNPLAKSPFFQDGGTRGTMSPDGTKIALEAPLGLGHDFCLFVIELDSSFNYKNMYPLWDDYKGCTPRWWPGSDRIFFAHHDISYEGKVALWSIKIDGTDKRRFETPTVKFWPAYETPSFSPDMKMVVYSKPAHPNPRQNRDSENEDLYIIRLIDGEEVKLTDSPNAYDGWPDWHETK